MDVTRSDIEQQFALVYPGSIYAFFRGATEHIIYVIHVSTLSRDAGSPWSYKKGNVSRKYSITLVKLIT